MWLLGVYAGWRLLGANDAYGAGVQAKSMRAALPALEVERGLVMPRGWLELELSFEDKVATGAWSPEGQPVEWESARWLYTTSAVGLRYGISPRAELYARVPVHYVRLTNDALGTDTSDVGMGDLRFGWRFEALHTRAPNRSLAFGLEVKAPSGQEAPGTLIGGPNTVTGFVMGTGQLDLGASVAYKQQVGPLGLAGSAAYVHRFSGVSQFVVETDQQQFLGRFRPGDEVRVVVSPGIQLGPLYPSADLLLRGWFEAEMGTTSGGVWPDRYLDALPGTGGWSLDLSPGLTVNLTRGVDLRAAVDVPLRGEDLAFFPLEAISPTRGLTWSGQLKLRY